MDEHFMLLLLFLYSISLITDGSMIRLTAGDDMYEGRLEVKTDENFPWGNVCDDSFNDTDATVVCRQLGLSRAGYFLGTYRHGSLDIVLDDVICTGTEEDIMDCSHSSKHNCNHDEDVGVRCDKTKPLMTLSGKTEGLLEVYDSNTSYAICNNNVASAESVSNVVCNSLGLSSSGIISTLQPSKGKTFLDGISCKGNESHVHRCTYKQASSTTCVNGFLVIKCIEVRLTHGSSSYEGRLEVVNNRKWGNVCDYGFTNAGASVVCRMLGLSWNGRFSSEFKNGTLPFILDKVKCSGRERSLLECGHGPWNTFNCDHNQDVGIECLPSMYLSLVGGFTAKEGLPTIQLGKYQAHICSHDFDSRDALVFCRELGYKISHAAVLPGRMYSSPTSYVLEETFHCHGYETKLVHCLRMKTSCPSSHRAAILCDPKEPDVFLTVPSPMKVNETINVTCTAVGGRPLPRLWWDCNGVDSPISLTMTQHNITSVLLIEPTIEYNEKLCTCYAHQEETTFPIIQRTETLNIYYPVQSGLNITVPILTEHRTGHLTCEANSGNPLPAITWNCSEIPESNLETASELGKTTLYIKVDKDYHRTNCTCLAVQNNTDFDLLIGSVSLHVLYAVSPRLSIISTNLVEGKYGYVICRANGGNPRPVARISCSGIIQPSNQIRLAKDTLSVLSFQTVRDLNGTRCVCFVNQPNSEFGEIQQSSILHVLP